MNCFRHPESGALGVCVACGKGLCTGCAREEGGTLHCEGACAERALLQVEALILSREHREVRRRIGVPMAIGLFLCGASLLALSIGSRMGWVDIVCVIVGSGAIALGVVVLVNIRAARRAAAEDLPPT